MKIKYKILDLTNNPDDLRAGDMVKLRKGMRTGQTYGGYILYKPMRFKCYKFINEISLIGSASIELLTSTGKFIKWYFPKAMLDLTCVKRPIRVERLN